MSEIWEKLLENINNELIVAAKAFYKNPYSILIVLGIRRIYNSQQSNAIKPFNKNSYRFRIILGSSRVEKHR